MARKRQPSPQTLAVLHALSENTSSWSYGYDLCQVLGLQAGTVYPILIRLADRGQVEAKWEEDPEPGRPPRHLYRLSRAGADLLTKLDENHAITYDGRSGSLAAEASS